MWAEEKEGQIRNSCAAKFMYVQIFLENFLFSEQINPVSKYFGSTAGLLLLPLEMELRITFKLFGRAARMKLAA